MISGKNDNSRHFVYGYANVVCYGSLLIKLD